MPVVAWRLGREPLFTYTVLLELGLLVAVALLRLEALRRGWHSRQVLEVLVWALIPGLAGGRLFYLLGDAIAEAAIPWSVWQPWGGGLSLPGALLAGAAGLGLLAALRGGAYVLPSALEGSGVDSFARVDCGVPAHWLAIVGAVVPGLALGQALGWLGAAAHGAAAGLPQPPSASWAPHLRDLYGVIVPRFPLQYLAAALSVFTWAILKWGRLRSDCERVACYASLTGLGLLALSFSLDGRQPVLAGLSLDQIAWLLIGLAGLAVTAWTYAKRHPRRTRAVEGAGAHA